MEFHYPAMIFLYPSRAIVWATVKREESPSGELPAALDL